jgi:sulfotransferase family protein
VDAKTRAQRTPGRWTHTFPLRRKHVQGVFLTHHKCGSNWLVKILDDHCHTHGLSVFKSHRSRGGPPRNHPYDYHLYVNSDYGYAANRYRALLDRDEGRVLHVIRNPLDIVVFAYYSHRYTHPVEGWSALACQRNVLRGLSREAGMMATWVFLERADFDTGMIGPLASIRTWNYDDRRFRTLCMEDLVSEQGHTSGDLRRLLGPEVSAVMARNTFQSLSGGRDRGTVDERHHYRSGVPHQWKHEMPRSLARALYHHYRDVVDTFYPEVPRWLGIG